MSTTSSNYLFNSVLEGIDLMIETFMSKRLDLRVYPFEKNPRFNIICNLKRDSFINADLENILFSYGTRPNVLLTIFGLITALPSAENTLFDPMTALEQSKDQQDRSFELGFRQINRALEGIDQLTRFSTYPNITVYPIAVYQKLGTINQDSTDL